MPPIRCCVSPTCTAAWRCGCGSQDLGDIEETRSDSSSAQFKAEPRTKADYHCPRVRWGSFQDLQKHERANLTANIDQTQKPQKILSLPRGRAFLGDFSLGERWVKLRAKSMPWTVPCFHEFEVCSVIGGMQRRMMTKGTGVGDGLNEEENKWLD